MGSLTPGASYVYESPDGGKTVYAREIGSPVNSRVMIGKSFEKELEEKERDETLLWKDIRKTAEQNPALQKALDQCIVLYHLVKKEEEVLWHPV